MADNRILAQLQHAIQYPSGHLDRFASFGPAFEMAEDRADDQPTTATTASTTEAELSESAAIRAFLTAGRAIFTLQGETSRYTFRVNRKDPEAGSTYQNPVYFVSILTGPNNVDDYTYVGILDVERGGIRLTRKSAYQAGSTPVLALNWVLGRIWRGREISPARFYHVGRCGRCGRALTVPSSIETGLGPECAGKLGE